MTIIAEIIADSISSSGVRITTFELTYPRIIHSELMTHRVFSRNAASSRAIPVAKMNETILDDIAMPIHFGKNQSGMQDAGEHFEYVFGMDPRNAWEVATGTMIAFSNEFSRAGYHKQVCNRLTEFAQHMKVVVTATSFDNWFWLRNHTDADPTIHALANTMLAAYMASEPVLLLPGEWHVPYYHDGVWKEESDGFDFQGHTLDEALKISSSCCAQVSYRKLDDTLEKANDVYARLVESEPVHASPTEHQATPVLYPYCDSVRSLVTIKGATHVDTDSNVWSGNFKHWIQHRQLIPNNVCNHYEYEQC